jgi:hypothetical protein
MIAGSLFCCVLDEVFSDDVDFKQAVIKSKLRPLIKRFFELFIIILFEGNQLVAILVPLLGIPKIQTGLQNPKDETNFHLRFFTRKLLNESDNHLENRV